MIDLPPPLRRATETDAGVLAELVNMAGEGLPLHLWKQMAGPGDDPWEIGRARQIAKLRSAEIVVVDEGNGAIAALTGYPIGPEPEPITEDMPPLFRPLQTLENQALSTWYVNVLATLPEARGRGLGSGLLGIAERMAEDAGLQAMSVIVADNNDRARRLYAAKGYAETSEAPMVRNGWSTDGRAWILMTKPL
jgi:ribosomal protein S18 acetylase RimI-like enzyme